MQQKLFTIYLSEEEESDLELRVHLGEYLELGWRIGSLTPLATGGGGETYLSCWFAVVLEWDDAGELPIASDPSSPE